MQNEDLLSTMAKQFLTVQKTPDLFIRQVASLLVYVMPKLGNEFKPSSDFITDRFVAVLLLWIFIVI